MKITAYNQHDVGSSHEPWSCSSHTTLLATSQRRYPIKRSNCFASRSSYGVEGPLSSVRVLGDGISWATETPPKSQGISARVGGLRLRNAIRKRIAFLRSG